MSCYTEGYITGIAIKNKEIPAKAKSISIETASSYRVRIGESDFGLFVAGNGDRKIDKIKKTGALIAHVPDGVKCEEFDAQFLLVLKQTHSKVRFVLNDVLNVLERIVAI